MVPQTQIRGGPMAPCATGKHASAPTAGSISLPTTSASNGGSATTWGISMTQGTAKSWTATAAGSTPAGSGTLASTSLLPGATTASPGTRQRNVAGTAQNSASCAKTTTNSCSRSTTSSPARAISCRAQQCPPASHLVPEHHLQRRQHHGILPVRAACGPGQPRLAAVPAAPDTQKKTYCPGNGEPANSWPSDDSTTTRALYAWTATSRPGTRAWPERPARPACTGRASIAPCYCSQGSENAYCTRYMTSCPALTTSS